MIEQQLYTRSSNGFFLNKPGYDTVRLSAGLDLPLAQENNNLFVYKGDSIKDIGDNISVISRYKLNNGDVMLNCSSPYSYKSYDGIKQTFISHSYIMNSQSEELAQQAKDVRQIAGVTDFIKTHIDGSNEALEQLSQLPFEESFPQIEYVKFVLKKFSKEFFSKIISAVLDSALTGKKVYIVPESITETQDILDILKAIYYFLPTSLRNKVGYVTSLNNQEVPTGVNIAFISSTYMSEIKSKNIFGYYIADDYCFDLINEEIIFAGNLDFYENTEFMQLIQSNYSKPESISEGISYFDKQLSDIVSFERIELLSKFVNEIYSKDCKLNVVVEIYKKIRLTFDKDHSLYPVKNLISSLSQSSPKGLNCEQINAVSELYSLVDEDYQDRIIEYIIFSIESSVENPDGFYSKLDACCKYTKIEGFVISRLIASANKGFISNYYNREFSKYSTIEVFFAKLNEYERNPILTDDGLLENNAFIKTVLDKVESLYSANKELETINKLYLSVNSLKKGKLVTQLLDKVCGYIRDFTQSIDAYSLSINDLNIIIKNYSSFADEHFVKISENILTCFNVVGDDSDKNKFYMFFSGANSEIIYLSNYFKRHFDTEFLDRHYFAYTIAYFNPQSKELNLKDAFRNIKKVYDIVHYTKWLVRKLDYIGSDNGIVGIASSDVKEEKYADLANAILTSLSNIDDSISSKDANSYTSELKEYMNLNLDTLEDMYAAFCKLIKKAMTGKQVEKIDYVNFKYSQKKAITSSQRLKSKNQENGNEISNESKKYIIIGAVLIVLAAVIIGVVFGINHFSKNKQETKKTETTVSSTIKSTSENPNLPNRDSDTTTQDSNVAISNIEDSKFLSYVTEVLNSMNEDTVDNIKDKDLFINNFNIKLVEEKLITKDNEFDFEAVQKHFDKTYTDYSNEFINLIHLNTNQSYIDEIYKTAYGKCGISGMDELTNNTIKKEFVECVEEELTNYVPDLPNISKDLNTYYAFEVLSNVYNNFNY